MIVRHQKLNEHMPVLQNAISHLLYAPPHRGSPKGGFARAATSAELLGTNEPLEVFRVRADQIRDGSFLKNATRSGWQYLLTGSDSRAIADVREDDGIARVGRLIRGRLADGLAKAAELATYDHGAEPEGYEARILEIPALYIVALWLHGAQDVFYPLMATRTVDRDRYDSDAFSELVFRKIRAHAKD